LNKYPKLRSVLHHGLKNFNNIAVEWVPGAAPTAYFYDPSGTQVSEAVLGDRSLTELFEIFAEKGFVPTVETTEYPPSPVLERDYGNHKYLFYSNINPYANALEQAHKVGGYIVTITSQQEQNFLGNVLNELQIRQAWLGATDQNEEGQWKWTEGPEKDVVFYSANPEAENTGFTFWFKGEPNNADTEDCASFFPDGWNDVSCATEKIALVVEVGNDPLVEPPVPPPTEQATETPIEEAKSDL
jgi:hypothetical protein